MNKYTKVINVRVELEVYDWIEKILNSQKLQNQTPTTTSELIRMIIDDYIKRYKDTYEDAQRQVNEKDNTDKISRIYEQVDQLPWPYDEDKNYL